VASLLTNESIPSNFVQGSVLATCFRLVMLMQLKLEILKAYGKVVNRECLYNG
jgi:hypothetical protein